MHGQRNARRGIAGRRPLLAGFQVLVLAGGGFLLFRHMHLPAGRKPAAPVTQAEDQAALVARLYCESCVPPHGARGAGDGPAAKFLFPGPGNFGSGAFRPPWACGARRAGALTVPWGKCWPPS